MNTIFNSKVFLISFFLLGILTNAQDNHKHNFYTEFHMGVKYNFGPTETQAEIVGGYDSLSYDHLQHYNPGYKTSVPIEFIFGYIADELFRIEGTLSYYKLDIGLVQTLNLSEYPFLKADMLSIKTSGLFGFNDIANDSSINFSSGISIGAVFPFSSNFSEGTKNNFGIKDFQSGVQIFFEINASGSLALSDRLYLSAGASFTLPWVVGSIGKLEMQPGSQYSIVRDEVILYSIGGYLGIGYIL